MKSVSIPVLLTNLAKKETKKNCFSTEIYKYIYLFNLSKKKRVTPPMATGRHRALIEGVFTLYPRKKHYLVTLKRSSLTYSAIGNEWGDINNGFYLQQTAQPNGSWVIDNGTDHEHDTNSPYGNEDPSLIGVTPAVRHAGANVVGNQQSYQTTHNNQKTNHNSNNNNDSNNDENKRPVGDSIHLADVVGCHCFKGKTPDDPRAYFTVYAYPFKKKILSGRKLRNRISVTFGVFHFEKFEDNLRIAEKWKNLIFYLARGKPVLRILEDIENIPLNPPRKMLVLINPFSGSGKSLKLFQQQVAPMFGEADIHYKILVTKYAGHAQEYVQSVDLSRWYGIVVMSGDGLVFEVINGLMSRPDWQKALKIPIGCIPAGSGNALCCSINYSAGEPILSNDVLHSTFVLIKHQVLPLDLVAIQMQNKSMYSFLSVTWGIIADIDYESEKYRRSLGSKRFLVLFAQRIIDLRSYRGRLSFIPIMALQDNSNGEDAKVRKLSRFVLDSNPTSRDNSLSGSECQLDGMDDCNWSPGHGLPKRSYTLPEGFNLKDKNEYNDNIPRNSRHHSENDLSLELNHSSHRNLSFNSCHDVSNSSYLIRNGNMQTTSEPFQNTSARRHSNSGHAAQDSVHLRSQQMVTADNVIIREETMTVRKGEVVPTPLLPPLDEDVPPNWVVIEDNFISMSASYQTHLGPDFLSAPDCRFNDGIIHLHFIRAGVSRNNLFSLFRAVEDGSHLDSPFVESVKVLAFRLEPLDNTGNIMVDGEHMECGTIQGQVLPGVANLMGIQ